MKLGAFVLNKLNKVKMFLFFVFLSFWITASNAESAGNDGLALIIEEASPAKSVVIDFQNALIGAMKKGDTLGFAERSLYLKQAILNSHDILKSLRTIVGSKQWRTFSDEQKTLLNQVFTKFIVSTYAFNFNVYSNESFVYVSEHITKKGNVIVRSILNAPESKRNKVTFDYALKKNSDGWRIYNIAADGVSDLATRRSEYRRILSGSDGFNTLIAIINKKIDNYAK